MIRLLPIAIAAVFAVAFLTTAAQAKAPIYGIEMSGGDLTSPIMLEPPPTSGWLDNYDRDAPAVAPSQTYTLRLIEADASGGIGPAVATWTYYPSHDGDAAAVRYDDGQFKTVSSSLAQAIEARLPQPKLEAESDGSSVNWWYAPSALALGLVVVGGGVTVLRRRRAS